MPGMSYPSNKVISINNYSIPKFEVEFVTQDSHFPSISASVVGGIPPYKYEWSISQGDAPGHVIVSDVTSSVLNLDKIAPSGSLIKLSKLNRINRSLIRLDITDSENLKNTFYCAYASEAYPVFAPNINREITSSFIGGDNFISSSVPWPGIDFMDNIESIPTYYDLNYIACPNMEISSSELLNSYSTINRGKRDVYVRWVSDKISFEQINDSLSSSKEVYSESYFNPEDPNNIFYTDINSSDYIPDYNNYLHTGSATIFYKMPFRMINYINVMHDYIIKIQWEKQFAELDNKSFSEILGANTKIEWLPIINNIENLPLDGVAGQAIFIREDTSTYLFDGLTYLWNPQTLSWDSTLGSIYMNEISVASRARRDSFIRSFYELTLSLRPFTAASIYLPMHRIRKELL